MGKIRGYVISGIVVVAIIVSFLFITQYLFGVFNPFYVVVSESMLPNLKIGDIVIIKNNTPEYSFNHLKKGDIIVFKAPGDYMEDGKPRVIVHRVANIQEFDINGIKRLVVTTKGDNNPDSYNGLDFPILNENYIGKVIYVLPKVGMVSMFLKPPVNYILIAIVGGATIFMMRRKKD